MYLTIKILNEGLRPHLTRHQAKFRKWYDEALKDESNKGLSPQDIQRKYEKYEELVSDFKSVNEILINYKDELEKRIHMLRDSSISNATLIEQFGLKEKIGNKNLKTVRNALINDQKWESYFKNVQ